MRFIGNILQDSPLERRGDPHCTVGQQDTSNRNFVYNITMSQSCADIYNYVQWTTSTGPYRSCAALLDISNLLKDLLEFGLVLIGLVGFSLVGFSLVWLVLV